PCVGSVDEPNVTAGNFCSYRGGISAGSKEAGSGVGNIDKNAKFVFFEAGSGFVIKNGEKTGTANAGDLGLLIVFRTCGAVTSTACETTFFSEGTPVEAIPAEANLNAAGSWAVTAK